MMEEEWPPITTSPFLFGILFGLAVAWIAMRWRSNIERDLPVPTRSSGVQTKIPFVSIGQSDIVLGEFGRPLGDTITIHGTVSASKSLRKDLTVESVNGVRVRHRAISVAGINEWPDGTKATFRGYEMGIIRSGGNTRRPPQEIDILFHVDEVVEPKDLPFDYKSQLSR